MLESPPDCRRHGYFISTMLISTAGQDTGFVGQMPFRLPSRQISHEKRQGAPPSDITTAACMRPRTYSPMIAHFGGHASYQYSAAKKGARAHTGIGRRLLARRRAIPSRTHYVLAIAAAFMIESEYSASPLCHFSDRCTDKRYSLLSAPSTASIISLHIITFHFKIFMTSAILVALGLSLMRGSHRRAPGRLYYEGDIGLKIDFIAALLHAIAGRAARLMIAPAYLFAPPGSPYWPVTQQRATRACTKMAAPRLARSGCHGR